MIDVLCVGLAAADVLVRPVDSIDFRTDTARVETIELNSGGDGLNVAIGLSKLGARSAFVGKIGNDYFGDFLAAVIDHLGIDQRGLSRTDKGNTCAVLAVINTAGERVFFYHGGTNDLFRTEDIDDSLVAESKIVHVGGAYLLPLFDGEGAAGLFAKARAQGKVTSMDVTWNTDGEWLKKIRPCLPVLDFFLPSCKEAERITGRSDPEEMAVFLQDLGVKTVVIKLGERGCYVKPPQGIGFSVNAFKTKVVDTTGAGDSFVAGFLFGLLQEWSLQECAKFASAVAAVSIQKVGATSGMPTYQEACSFLANVGDE